MTVPPLRCAWLVLALLTLPAAAQEDGGSPPPPEEEPADAGAALPQPTGLLVGTVRSRGNREPIPFATVVCDYETTTTTESGDFRVAVGPGTRKVSVQAAGFFSSEFIEELREGDQLTVIYSLLPRQLNPYETVVRADRARTEVARVALRDAEIREVPGTSGDPFRVVMLMPGVSSIASGVSYPVVRGSSPASTGYFLDGVRVPQLFHVFLGPAVVHPDFVEGIDFYAGGAPARYGRLLAGVVDGKLARPADELKASAYVDLLNAGLKVDVPIAATDTRLSAAGRLSYTALMIGAASALVVPPGSPKLVANFWDYQLRVDQGLAGGRLRLFSFGSSDLFGTERNPADPLSSSSLQGVLFHRVDARYRHSLGAGELEAGVTFGRDLIELRSEGPLFAFDVRQSPPDCSQFDCGYDKSLGTRSSVVTIDQTSVGGRVQWSGELSDEWSTTVGVSLEHVGAGFQEVLAQLRIDDPSKSVSASQADPASRVTISSAFLELPWHPAAAPSLRIVSGIRFDNWFLMPSFNVNSIDPRVAAFWGVTDALELHASVGSYHQPPTFLINLPVVDVASVQFGLQSAIQTSVGARWKLNDDLELSADGYVNVLPRAVEIGIFDDEVPWENQYDPNRFKNFPGAKRGVAYGIEAMLRWPQKGHFFGWLTASLSRSQRRTSFIRFDEAGKPAGTATGDIAYAFDQTFIANAVLSYRFDNGFSVGTTLHFNTGRPESGELTSRTNRPHEQNGTVTLTRLSRDEVDRLPPYFRVDVRVAKTWLTDRLSVELFLDVLNVLVRQEVLSYSYSSYSDGSADRVANGVPVIIPNLGLKVRY